MVGRLPARKRLFGTGVSLCQATSSVENGRNCAGRFQHRAAHVSNVRNEPEPLLKIRWMAVLHVAKIGLKYRDPPEPDRCPAVPSR